MIQAGRDRIQFREYTSQNEGENVPGSQGIMACPCEWPPEVNIRLRKKAACAEDAEQECGSKSLCPTAEQGGTGPGSPVNHAFQIRKVDLSARKELSAPHKGGTLL